MLFIEAPEPKEAFCEAYEFCSDTLRKDHLAKDFAIQWHVPPAEIQSGRWQAIAPLEKQVHEGRFIAHGLPPGKEVNVRVLEGDEESDWVTVQTLALPDVISDIQQQDAFGKRLGGIAQLCSGWLLNQGQTAHNKFSTRCMRCGCESRQHEAVVEPVEEESPQLAASASASTKPEAAGKAKAAAKRGRAKAAKPWSLLPDGTLPLPTLAGAFCETVILDSDVLASGPAEFKVEWQSPDGTVQPASWDSSPYRNLSGQFYVDCLPPGETVNIRIKSDSFESDWMSVTLQKLPKTGSRGSTVRGTRGTCSSFLHAVAAKRGIVDTSQCLRCGRLGTMHKPANGTASSSSKSAPQDPLGLSPVITPIVRSPRAFTNGKKIEPRTPIELGPHEGSVGHPLPLEDGVMVETAGQLEFLTNFECSNGELYVKEGASQGKFITADKLLRYHIILRADPGDGSESTQRKRWFYFGIRGARNQRLKGTKIRLVVNNMSNMRDLYNLDGHRPFYRNVPHSLAWQRIKEPNRFDCKWERPVDKIGVKKEEYDDSGEEDRSDEKADDQTATDDKTFLPNIMTDVGRVTYQSKTGKIKTQKTCYIAWDFEFEFDDGVTYFAFSPPYGYADLQEYLGRLDAFFSADPGSRMSGVTPLPAYMVLPKSTHPQGHVQPIAPIKPDTVVLTIEHATNDAKMKLTVRKDATILQVREAIVAALGWKRMSSVKLVKRLGGRGSGTLTPLSDNDRLHAKQHLLMVGDIFDDGIVVNPLADKKPPEPAAKNSSATSSAGACPAEEWSTRVGDAIYFHRERFCLSCEGRWVDMLTVSEDTLGKESKDTPIFVEAPPTIAHTACLSGSGAPSRYIGGGRRIIFISSRIHPGETPAQFAFFGFLQFVLSDDPRAKLLRKLFVFKLVPMLNPDGVAHGHTRSNTHGLDLNRCYAEPNCHEHESVFWVMQWLRHWADQGRLMFYLDMHAHAHTRGCVLYGNDLAGAAQVWNISFAHVCQLNAPHFDVDGSEFPPHTDKEHGYEASSTDNSGRARIAAACRLYHAYTLECHYSVGRQTRPVQAAPGLERRPTHPGIGVNTTAQVPYNTYEWESIGEGIAVSILDMHGVNPHSRIGSLQAVLKRVADKLKIAELCGAGEDFPKKMERNLLHTDMRGGATASLWRVKHQQVIARAGPALTQPLVEAYNQGCLLSAVQIPDNSLWLKLAAPQGHLGGKLNTHLSGNKEAFMLTDGSQKGLGILLEPTGLHVKISESSNSEKNLSNASPAKDVSDRVPTRKFIEDPASQLAFLL